jgi:hypothetical protein
MPNNQPATILFSFIGVLLILLAILNKPLLLWMGIKPRSEVFTNPNFQRSAKVTEKLGQWVLILLGAGFLVQGLGNQFLSGKGTYIVTITLLGLSGLLILAGVGMVLANWKTK